MQVSNAQITFTISKEEKDVITNLYKKAAINMGLSLTGIGDLVAAIYDGADSERCRISSVDSIEVNLQYNN